MKKFEVNYEKNFHLILDVEAKDEEEAKEKADEMIEKMDYKEVMEKCQEGYFEHTYTDKVE